MPISKSPNSSSILVEINSPKELSSQGGHEEQSEIVAKLKLSLVKLKSENECIPLENAALLNSSSWRVTAPLRLLGNFFKKLLASEPVVPNEVGADALNEFPPHKFNGPQTQPDTIPKFSNVKVFEGLRKAYDDFLVISK
jgi:hypothetical protein